MHHFHQVDAAHPVDRRVVNLGHHCIRSLGDAWNIVEPFDDGEFPRRARQVERAGEYPCCLDAKLAPVTGFGQGNVADMIFKIEIRVFDPIGIVEVERHANKPLADCAAQLFATVKEVQDILEADEATWRCGRVVNQDRADMHRRIRRFERDEARIHALQLSQGRSPVTARSARVSIR